MENRRLNHLRHIRAVLGRARVLRIADGETYLIVDHQMNGAARFVTTGLRHLEGFHDHALAGERSVTMDGNRQYLVASLVAATILAGPHRAFDHRRDNLQVGRVEGQRQVYFPALGHDVGREALVIFHVTGRQPLGLLALELVEQIARILAEGIHQDVEATAVRHADDDFLGAVGTTALDDFVKQGNQAFPTLKTKAFGTGILGTQVFFQTLGGRQTLQQVAAHVGGVQRATAHTFQALGKPLALFRVDDMRELCTNIAAIGLLQRLMDFSQGGLFLADEQFTGTEGGVQIGISQTVMMNRQVGRRLALPKPQRIELGGLVAAHAEGLNQAQYFNLLLLMLAADGSGRNRLGTPLVLGQQDEMITNRGV